jgi:transcriptional regulator with XRE-family HTH domain
MSDGFHRLTCGQVRGARAMLRWTIKELADQTKVSVSTLKRIENENGPVRTTIDTLVKLHQCFTAMGIIFLEDDGLNGPGLRFNCSVLA